MSRAAVFTQQPQAVEVYQAGAWWAGELLGWRHEDDGSCRMRVRVVLGGREETAWVDLAGLRLPEPAPALPVAGAVPGAPVPVRPTGRRRAPEEPGTVAMPAPAGARPGGRRRAPEVPGAAGGPDAPSTLVAPTAVPPGVRRRAPEGRDAGSALVGAGAAAAPARHPAVGRAGAGRHRRADTDVLPAVPSRPVSAAVGPDPVPARAGLAAAADPAASVPSAPPVPRGAAPARSRPRADRSAPGAPGTSGAAEGDPEPDLLTRPLRLGDHVPGARRPRLDGSLARA